MEVAQVLDGGGGGLAGGGDAVHMVSDGLGHRHTHGVERAGGTGGSDGNTLYVALGIVAGTCFGIVR